MSGITGRRQGPALRVASLLAFVMAFAAVLLDGTLAVAAATGAVVVVVATPLLRVLWLVLRWVQERDWRFVAIASGLLLVVAVGAGAALLAG